MLCCAVNDCFEFCPSNHQLMCHYLGIVPAWLLWWIILLCVIVCSYLRVCTWMIACMEVRRPSRQQCLRFCGQSRTMVMYLAGSQTCWTMTVRARVSVEAAHVAVECAGLSSCWIAYQVAATTAAHVHLKCVDFRVQQLLHMSACCMLRC